MDNKELLKKFRFGNRKVEDRLTGKIYVAKGTLADKTKFLRRFTIGNLILPPVMFVLSPQNASFKLPLCAILYLFTFFDIFLLGRFIIKEDDLKDVEEL